MSTIIATVATLVYNLVGATKGTGDFKFELDATASGAKEFGDRGNLYLPIIAANGKETRLPLRRNIYIPKGAGSDVSTVKFSITAETVAGAPVAAPLDALQAMKAAKDEAGLAAFYATLPGVTKTAAGKMAKAACK